MSRGRLAALAVAVAAACRQPNTPPAPLPSIDVVHIAHQPPTAKDIVAAVIESAAVPLSVSRTCQAAGTEPIDTTIGRFVAGFLAELSAADAKNWIETTSAPDRSASGAAITRCRLIVRHQDGDDRWGWGVEFDVRADDGAVVANSFTCVGAG